MRRFSALPWRWRYYFEGSHRTSCLRALTKRHSVVSRLSCVRFALSLVGRPPGGAESEAKKRRRQSEADCGDVT